MTKKDEQDRTEDPGDGAPEEKVKRRIVAFIDYPCIDGLACAWALKNKYPKDGDVDLKIVGLNHNESWLEKIEANIQEGDEVIFADTSPKTGILEALGKPLEGDDGVKRPRLKSITVYDHHDSEAGLTEFAYTPADGEEELYPALNIINKPDAEAAALVVFEELFGRDEGVPEILKWVGKLEPSGHLQGREEYAIASFIDSKPIKPDDNDLQNGIDESLKAFEELTGLSRTEMLAQGEPILTDQIRNLESMFDKPMFVYLELGDDLGHAWVPVVEGTPSHYGRAFDYLAVKMGQKGSGPGVAGAFVTDPASGRVLLRLRSDGVTPHLRPVAEKLKTTFNRMKLDEIQTAEADEQQKAELNVTGGGHGNAYVLSFKTRDIFNALVRIQTEAQMRKLNWVPRDERLEATKPQFEKLDADIAA